MKLLKCDLLKNGNIIKKSVVPYQTSMDFFVALVTISDILNIEVPIWTLKEDQLLEKNKEVIMPIQDSMLLRIYVDDE